MGEPERLSDWVMVGSQVRGGGAALRPRVGASADGAPQTLPSSKLQEAAGVAGTGLTMAAERKDSSSSRVGGVTDVALTGMGTSMVRRRPAASARVVLGPP